MVDPLLLSTDNRPSNVNKGSPLCSRRTTDRETLLLSSWPPLSSLSRKVVGEKKREVSLFELL